MSLALVFALIAPDRAGARFDAPDTPEDWAWNQIKLGNVADLNDRCERKLDPRDPTSWDEDDPCRQISAEFLIDVLIMRKNEVPRQGVRLSHAQVTGNIKLHNAEVGSEVWLDHSQIKGNLDISGAHFKQPFTLDGSVVKGELLADGMVTDSDIRMTDGVFIGDVQLNRVQVGGELNMSGASFRTKLIANNLNVHYSLHMRGGIFYGEVSLDRAAVGDLLVMDGATFWQTLHANAMDIQSSLSMRDGSFHGPVNLAETKIGSDLFMNSKVRDRSGKKSFANYVSLRGAKVGHDVNMENASFLRILSAIGLDVRNDLFMNADFADVELTGAKVGGNLIISKASFSKELLASYLDVVGRLKIQDASFADDVMLRGAKVGELSLSSITASRIDLSDLSGAPGSELALSEIHWWCHKPKRATDGPETSSERSDGNNWPLGSLSWRDKTLCDGDQKSVPSLKLRNAHIEEFQDDGASWPPMLDLAGLRYERLGEIARTRTSDQWIDWLARSLPFNRQPYYQLAAVLTAAGRSDTAEAILFAGRDRERDGLVLGRSATGSWSRLWTWVWLSLFAAVAGYGIGLYTFRVLGWVVFFTILGAALLKFTPDAQGQFRKRSIPWLLGASLQRLLPIITLNKEFDDFFDNSKEPVELTGWQNAFFSIMAMVGYVLTAFLIAAIGTLTPK